MQTACERLQNFDCDDCANKGFGFRCQPGTRRLYKFPTTIGAEGGAALLFVGINPRRSESNAELHERVASDLKAFDELSRNRVFGGPYIATNGKERHYRTHARIAETAMNGSGLDRVPFERVAACTEVFLCATEDATPGIAASLRTGESPCADKHFWNTLNRVQPHVVIAVGTLVCDFLSRYCQGSPPRLNVAHKPALLAIPHPSNRTLSVDECAEVGRICRALMSSAKDGSAALSSAWDYRDGSVSRAARTGNMIERDIDWSMKYGWKPHHRPADLDWLEEDSARKIRYRLMKDGTCRYSLELDAKELRSAIGNYVYGPQWKRTGYVNPITVFAAGEPTEKLKSAWRCFARAVTQ